MNLQSEDKMIGNLKFYFEDRVMQYCEHYGMNYEVVLKEIFHGIADDFEKQLIGKLEEMATEPKYKVNTKTAFSHQQFLIDDTLKRLKA